MPLLRAHDIEAVFEKHDGVTVIGFEAADPGAYGRLVMDGETLTAITGGRVLTGTSVIENGTVVISGGRIVSVGTGAAPAGARAISSGAHYYTLINYYTTLYYYYILYCT